MAHPENLDVVTEVEAQAEGPTIPTQVVMVVRQVEVVAEAALVTTRQQVLAEQEPEAK